MFRLSLARCPFVAFLFTTTIWSQANVLVVDDVAGPGIDYIDPKEAISAAMDGDIVLVKDGVYLYPQFDSVAAFGKSLTIVAEAGATVVFRHLTLIVDDLSPSQSVTVRGIDFDGARLIVDDSDGSVWLEDLNITPPQFAFANAGLLVTDSSRVSVQRCTVFGADSDTVFPVTDSPALEVIGSTVRAYDSSFLGGEATASFPGDDGSAGVEMLSGSTLFASGCHFEGGDADSANTGGSALLAGAGTASVILDCTFQEGSPGGLLLEGTGSTTFLPQTRRSFELPSAIREGATASLSFTGQPGDLIFLAYSLAPGDVYVPLLNGPLLVALQPTVNLFGTVAATGVLSAPILIGNLAPGLEGVVAFGQPAFLAVGQGVVLGGASATVLLDSSL